MMHALLSTAMAVQVTFSSAVAPTPPVPPVAAMPPVAMAYAQAAAAPAAVNVTQPKSKADSVYRLARMAMEREDWERAAELFGRIREQYGSTSYAKDADYWLGFSRYRMGGSRNLSMARDVLRRQVSRYPDAPTTTDARALLERITGQLARGGDAASAEALTASVSQLAAASDALAAQSARLGSLNAATTRSYAMSPACGGSCGAEADPPECKNSDTDERIEALNALMQMDAERAVPILEKVLKRRDACSVRLRRKAVFIVSQQRRSGVEDVLLEAVKSDPDRNVREQSVFWLGQVGTDRAVQVLDQLVRSNSTTAEDVSLKRKAIFAISQLKGESVPDKLANYAADASLGIEAQGEALQWLGQRDGGAAQVKKIWPKLTSPALKEKALFAYSQARDGGGAKWLLEVASDDKEPPETRRKALFWAGQSRYVDIDDLSAFYTKSADRELKQQFAFVLSQRREPAAIDRLMDIAKNDADKEVRKKAIFWLSQSRDPRVAKFLEDLISKDE